MDSYDLESWLEAHDIMSDPELMESIRESRREAAEGKLLRLRDHI